MEPDAVQAENKPLGILLQSSEKTLIF